MTPVFIVSFPMGRNLAVSILRENVSALFAWFDGLICPRGSALALGITLARITAGFLEW
jgi:hypothetical protein